MHTSVDTGPAWAPNSSSNDLQSGLVIGSLCLRNIWLRAQGRTHKYTLSHKQPLCLVFNCSRGNVIAFPFGFKASVSVSA